MHFAVSINVSLLELVSGWMGEDRQAYLAKIELRSHLPVRVDDDFVQVVLDFFLRKIRLARF